MRAAIGGRDVMDYENCRVRGGEGCDTGILRSTRQPVFRPWKSHKPTGANKLRDPARAAADIYSGTKLNRQ